MSVEFDIATNSRINLGSAAIYDNLTVKSAMMWAYIVTATNDRLISKDNNNTATFPGWNLYTSNHDTDQVKITWNEGWLSGYGSWEMNTKPFKSTWFHIAVTSTGNELDDPLFYYNSVLTASTENVNPAGASRDDSAAAVYVAGQHAVAGNSLDGSLEDVRLFNRIITAKEVLWHQQGYRGPLGGEIMWMTMNDAEGVSGSWEGQSIVTGGANDLIDIIGSTANPTPVGTSTGRITTLPRFGAVQS